MTIPTGVDVDYYKPLPGNTVEENALVFCGSMDWLPNENAIVFSLKTFCIELEKKYRQLL